MLSNLVLPKTQTMKLSSFYELSKHDYKYLELIVTKGNKNNNTDQIAALVNTMYERTTKQISKEAKKLIITQCPKASMYIHITKTNVQFFFMVPKLYTEKFKVKFNKCWKNIEIQEVDGLPIEVNDCSKFDIYYENNDSLSIAVNKTNNDLLNSNMTITGALEEGEIVGIFYNFIPTSEKETQYFRNKTYKNDIKNYTQGKSLKKNKTAKDYRTIGLKYFINIVNEVFKTVLGQEKDKKKNKGKASTAPLIVKDISSSTKRKIKSDLCKSQTIILTKSDTKKRELELGKMLANTYDEIRDDNKLVMNEVTKSIDIQRKIVPHFTVNRTTIEEDSNYINMPSNEIINQFKMIKHNKILELDAPKCLEKGELRIGYLKNKQFDKWVYYSTDKEFKKLSRIIMGSMGSGKDFYLTHYLAADIIRAGRGLIVIDYIDKCQLAEGIKKITPRNKLIEINCDNIAELQSFIFNEMNYKDSDSNIIKLEVSMQKAKLFQVLLDSVNDVKSELSPRMLRYLYCAGTVSIMLNKNASFKNVIDLLKSPTLRKSTVESMSEELKELLSEEIEDLKELDKIDKSSGKLINYDSKIDGILDRITNLKSSSLFVKMAYMGNGENNIDFVKAMNERKVILIKIPHKRFKDKMLKDLMCTFFLNKIWLAKQEADHDIQTEVFINEIHQSPHSQLLLEDIFVEHRKYNLTLTLAMHYMDQLTPKCQKSIMSAGASFVLLSGCDPAAYTPLEVHFKKDGYTKDTIAELDRHHALCLIKNELTNYSSFIVNTEMKPEQQKKQILELQEAR